MTTTTKVFTSDPAAASSIRKSLTTARKGQTAFPWILSVYIETDLTVTSSFCPPCCAMSFPSFEDIFFSVCSGRYQKRKHSTRVTAVNATSRAEHAKTTCSTGFCVCLPGNLALQVATAAASSIKRMTCCALDSAHN